MDLTTHERKILGTMRRIRDREEGRASDAGEDREEIGSLLELTGLHKKAFSFVRSLDRMAEEKRNDVIRSLHPLLAMMQPHWDGGTKDWVDETGEDEEPEPEGEAPSADVIEAFAQRGHEEAGDLRAPTADLATPEEDGSDTKAEIRADSDEFEASVAELEAQAPRQRSRAQRGIAAA
jgi:hypothetical protein